MLKRQGRSFDGLRVSVSGSGNVAQYAVEKAMALGAKVVTVSDSSGTVIDEEGFTPEKLAELMEVKNHLYGRVSDYAKRSGAHFEAGGKALARAGGRGAALCHPERAGRRRRPC
jgi:glutamate dehydrogenase (NADP+)